MRPKYSHTTYTWHELLYRRSRGESHTTYIILQILIHIVLTGSWEKVNNASVAFGPIKYMDGQTLVTLDINLKCVQITKMVSRKYILAYFQAVQSIATTPSSYYTIYKSFVFLQSKPSKKYYTLSKLSWRGKNH